MYLTTAQILSVFLWHKPESWQLLFYIAAILLVTGIFILYQNILLRRRVKERTIELNRQLIETESAMAVTQNSRERLESLNTIVAGMLEKNELKDLYSYTTDSLHRLFPNTIVLYISVDESNRTTILEATSGVDETLLGKAASLSGKSLQGSTYDLTDHHLDYFRSGRFVEFEGGLAEFSAGKFPKAAADAVEKAAGISRIYTIGINRDDTLLGAIHFFTLKKSSISEGAFVEALVKQAGLVIQKRLTKEELVHSRDLMQYVIEHNRSSVAVFDNDRNFIYVSRSFLAEYELKTEDVIGKRHYEVFPELSEAWREIHSKALNGEVTTLDEDIYRRKDGTQGITRWQCRPWYRGQKTIGGYVVYTEEITEQKKSEQRLRDAMLKAEESNRLKSAFMQNMSHEIRTPLNAIIGFSQLMAEPGQPTDLMKDLAQMLLDGSDRLTSVVNDVIEISQIQAGLAEVKRDEYDLISLVKEIFTGQKSNAEEKGLILTLDLNIETEKLTVKGDRYKTRRIISHLTDNAIKFTHEGSVTIKCVAEKDNFSVAVTDTGIGIAQDTAKIIFEPFRQLETDMRRTPGGIGLGLPIVKAYAELMQGKVTLASSPNIGSTFTVALPLNREVSSGKSGEERHNESNEVKEDFSGRIILIADDDYASYIMIKKILEPTGAKILYATNGKESIDFCRDQSEIDLIVMDLRMPEMDGFTATKMIREFRHGLPIIALTAFPAEINKVKIAALFDDYVVKPYDRTILIEIIKKYLPNATK